MNPSDRLKVLKDRTPARRHLPDRPGYVAPYRKRHRAVTAQLTNEEFARLKEIADAAGIAPSRFLANVAKGAIGAEDEKLSD
jgi:hypothetical protein